jgi:hypothetical protein
LGCVDVKKEGDLKEFVKNHKMGVMIPNSFGTKSKRQRQFLVTPKKANISLPKPLIPRVRLAPTLLVMAPKVHVVEAITSMQVKAFIAWS